MSGLKDSLGQILAVEGVRTVALIDLATGMVVSSAGALDARFPATAACIAEEAKLARAALEPGQPDEELGEISLTATRSLHLSKLLDTRIGDGLLLFVDIDRARSNVALATLQVRQLAPSVLV